MPWIISWRTTICVLHDMLKCVDCMSFVNQCSCRGWGMPPIMCFHNERGMRCYHKQWLHGFMPMCETTTWSVVELIACDVSNLLNNNNVYRHREYSHNKFNAHTWFTGNRFASFGASLILLMLLTFLFFSMEKILSSRDEQFLSWVVLLPFMPVITIDGRTENEKIYFYGRNCGRTTRLHYSCWCEVTSPRKQIVYLLPINQGWTIKKLWWLYSLCTFSINFPPSAPQLFRYWIIMP